jgi:hypothetical protein
MSNDMPILAQLMSLADRHPFRPFAVESKLGNVFRVMRPLKFMTARGGEQIWISDAEGFVTPLEVREVARAYEVRSDDVNEY